jgi:hypothetical protein
MHKGGQIMPKLPSPHVIAAIVVLSFAAMANTDATIKALEQEQKILDDKIFDIMRRTYIRLKIENKLRGHLKKEYESFIGYDLVLNHQS